MRGQWCWCLLLRNPWSVVGQSQVPEGCTGFAPCLLPPHPYQEKGRRPHVAHKASPGDHPCPPPPRPFSIQPASPEWRSLQPAPPSPNLSLPSDLSSSVPELPANLGPPCSEHFCNHHGSGRVAGWRPSEGSALPA